jgi:hypothetical protein
MRNCLNLFCAKSAVNDREKFDRISGRRDEDHTVTVTVGRRIEKGEEPTPPQKRNRPGSEGDTATTAQARSDWARTA